MVHSLALLHYPYLVYRGDEKKLWDPIRQQTLKIRPEERVRQRLLNCFILESIYPKSRISTESGVRSKVKESTERSDILCYNASFEPELLVECKAASIKISEQTAVQIARYNKEVGAPVLLLTNGIYDYWYELDSESAVPVSTPPERYRVETPSRPDMRYWIDRGFLGNNTSTAVNEPICRQLNKYWIEPEPADPSISFLSFNQHPEHIILDHYYWIKEVEKDPRTRLAMAFLASKIGDSHLVCIINRNKENMGFIDINFTLLDQDNKADMFVYANGDRKSLNAEATLSLQPISELDLGELSQEIANWFFNSYSAN
jgi:hypothetical protein